LINHIFSYHTLVDFLLFVPVGFIAGGVSTAVVYYLWCRISRLIKIRNILKTEEWVINNEVPSGMPFALTDDNDEFIGQCYKTTRDRILIKTQVNGQDIHATYCQGKLHEVSEMDWMTMGGLELMINSEDEEDDE